MASTYTLNNGIELIGTGEQSGTWGDTTNTNLELLDTALDGQVTITASSAGNSGSPNSLPITDGSASNGRNRLINITSGSDLGATVFYQLTPNDAEKIVYIRNSLNAQDLIVFQGTYNSSNDYVIPNGTTAVVFFNGAGSGAVAANVFNNAHFDAMNVVGGVTITTDDNTAQLTLISTDADAGIGPHQVYYRNSSSPADNDLLAEIDHRGRNDNSQDVDYVTVNIFAEDVSDGTEDGKYLLQTKKAGATVSRMDVNSTETVFNEDGADLDFRVESDNLANALFVDAAEDKVFIGHGTTHQYDAFGAEIIMQIEAAGTAPYAGIGMVQNSNDADIGPLIFGKSRGTSLGSTTIVQDGDLLGRIEFQGMDGSDLETGASIFAAVDGTPGADDMPGRLVFNTTGDGGHSPSERMRIDQQGTVYIGTVDTHAWDGAFDGRLRIGDRGFLGTTSGSVQMGYNWYWDGSAYKRIDTDFANRYYQNGGEHVWDTAVSGSGDSAITWVERMKIANDGSISSTTAGTSNVRFGVNAGNSITSGTNYNVCIGDEAGTALNGGDQNTAVGYAALMSEDGNSSNTAIGYQALKDQNGGDGNVAVGNRALENLTNASRCTAVGSDAGLNSLGADDVVFIGNDAGKFATTATNSVFIGSQAGQGVGATPLTGNNNVIIGESAGLNIQGTATLNTYVGTNAGRDATTVSNNTFIGAFAGDSATSGDNTGVGSGALGGSLTGDQNTAVGHDAGNGLTSGTDNVMIGHLAGVSATTAGDCTLVGEQAGGGAVLTGNGNTFVGRAAGYAVSSGASNVFLGQNAGRASSPSGNQTTGSGTVCLGDDNVSDLFCADTSISSSDSRDKTDITDFNIGLNWIKDLRPVTYKWDKRSWYGTEEEPYGTPDGSKKKSKVHIGFVAQEVLEIEKANGFADSKDTMLTCNLTEDNQRYGMKYERLVPILVNAIKELSAKVETLETKVTALEG